MRSQYSVSLIQCCVKQVEMSGSEPKFRAEFEQKSHVCVLYSPRYFALLFQTNRQHLLPTIFRGLTCITYFERERTQNVETYNKNFCETIKICKYYCMHLRVGRRFNSGFTVCYIGLHSVSLKQTSRFEEGKRGVSAMHYHLDITHNNPKFPLHPFTKI